MIRVIDNIADAVVGLHLLRVIWRHTDKKTIFKRIVIRSPKARWFDAPLSFRISKLFLIISTTAFTIFGCILT